MTLTRVMATMLLLGAPGALAQGTQPPAQIANHANGLAYQPTLGGVATREQSAGVRPSDRQLSQEDKELEQLNRQLLGPKAKPLVPAARQ